MNRSAHPSLVRLGRQTLRRQFPRLRGRGTATVLELFDRIGPVQSQVPRTPFLTAASRLPGVDHATVTALLNDQRLVKASTLRGTVHVGTAAQHAWSATVSSRLRAGDLAQLLELGPREVQRLTEAIEAYCADTWRTREEVVAWALQRLGHRPDPSSALANQLWGHPTLLRRPTDGAWEKRTDALRRTAPAAATGGVDLATARRELVRAHLRGYGPATRRDLAWWSGERLTAVDQAVLALGDEVVSTPGPARDPLLDLAVPPAGGSTDPGVRLLPEFDGLLLGYHPAHRERLLAPAHLPYVWTRANGLFAPLVLARGRIAATWRTRPGRRTALEITLLPGVPLLTESEVADAVTATATALALEVTEVRIGPHPDA